MSSPNSNYHSYLLGGAAGIAAVVTVKLAHEIVLGLIGPGEVQCRENLMQLQDHLRKEARLSVHGFRLRMDANYGSGNGPARQSHIRSFAPFSDKVRAAMAADDWAAASTLAECDAINSVTTMQVRNWPTSVRPFGKPSNLKIAALIAAFGATWNLEMFASAIWQPAKAPQPKSVWTV